MVYIRREDERLLLKQGVRSLVSSNSDLFCACVLFFSIINSWILACYISFITVVLLMLKLSHLWPQFLFVVVGFFKLLRLSV